MHEKDVVPFFGLLAFLALRGELIDNDVRGTRWVKLMRSTWILPCRTLHKRYARAARSRNNATPPNALPIMMGGLGLEVKSLRKTSWADGDYKPNYHLRTLRL